MKTVTIVEDILLPADSFVMDLILKVPVQYSNMFVKMMVLWVLKCPLIKRQFSDRFFKLFVLNVFNLK